MAHPAHTLVLTIANAERIRPELDRIGEISVTARYELSETRDPRVLAEGLDGAWASIAGSEPYTREVFDAAPSLEAILRWGTGSDAIDIDAATDAGVAVVTTPGVNAEAVADMALALMLSCIRGLPRLDQAVRAGRWRGQAPTGDLAGATVGVIGLGAIGRAVVRRLGGFDCRVLAVEPDPDLEFCAEHRIELTDLEALLPQVDVLTVHAPLMPATRRLIGARELALLPRHAIVVNAARGELVDQEALVAALEDGRIAGAGLDVYEHEPPAPDDPILSAPNTVLSPHVSSYTELGLDRTAEAVLANLRELLDGRLPASCLNPAAWS
jgi:phosphoglycerate dehydrogenase-like enzyme